MTSVRAIVIALVLASTLASTSRARAEGRDPAAAQALFDAGREAMTRGDLPAACARFTESQRLDPGAGTLLNLADCEERRGRLADSWEAWREAIASMPEGDERLPVARQRERAIERRVPRLTVRLAPGAPEGTIVRRDGIELGAAAFGLALPVNPGEHALEILAPGRAPRRVPATLREGETRELTVETGPPIAPPPAPSTAVAPAPPARPVTPPPARRATPVVGYVALGAGALGLGAAVVTGVLAMARKSTMNDHCNAAGLCDTAGYDAATSGRTFATVSTVAAIGGAALVAAGAVLVLTSPRPGAPTSAIGVGAMPGGATVAWTRSF